jgi:predicted esterase
MAHLSRLVMAFSLVAGVWGGAAQAAVPILETQTSTPAPVDKARVDEVGKTLQKLLQGKEYALAAEVAAVIAELDPENPSTHYTLGLVRAKAGKVDAAFAALEQAKALGFSNAFALLLHPYAHALHDDKRFSRLLEGILVSQVIRVPVVDVRQRQALLGQGHLRIAELLKAKQFAKAALVVRAMEAAERGYPLIEYSKARLAAAQGRTDAAFAHLAKSIEQGMSMDKWLTKEDDLLAALRDDERMAPLVEKAKKAPKHLMGSLYERCAPMDGVKSVEGKPASGLAWRIHMAPDATKAKPNRLIVWLHGQGGSGNAYVEPHAPALVRKGFALLVFPHKDWMKWNGRQISAAIAEAGKVDGIDNRKPVMMCYSLGGQRGALPMWYSQPEQFGGLIINSAYPLDRKANKQRQIKLHEFPDREGRKDVPILVFVGTRDAGKQIWELAEDAYPKLGIDLTVHYIPNAAHVFLMGKDRLPVILKWLDKIPAFDAPQE